MNSKALMLAAATIALVPVQPVMAACKEAAANPDLRVSVPYEEFTLSNGLRVIVSEDRKAPLVAVSVWYRVGSRDEPEGRTGFAHLFEHLMFGTTENNTIGLDKPLSNAGAIGINGTTAPDRTNYFETVPTSGLDLALWLESERMGHLLGAVTQEKLDQQRGVVQNEKREGDNSPYGLVVYRQLKGLFPPGHPYRHETIGSIEDLNAASLDDVKNWFRQYYGAANTVVSLAGDIDVRTARTLMEKYFGDIEPGPPLTRSKAWVPALSANVVDEMQDQLAPRVKVMRSWAVPGRGEKDATMLEMATNVLGRGKTARLYDELVVKRQLADAVDASIQAMDLASIVEIEVTLKPGADEKEVRRVIDDVSTRFIAEGPTPSEIALVKGRLLGTRIRQVEQVGGLGKGLVLAMGAVHLGDPRWFAGTSEWIRVATPLEVQTASRTWLEKPYYELTVRPFPKLTATPSTLDRSKGLPSVGTAPDVRFPAIERATLRNGAKVVLAQRTAAPVVNVAVQFDAGYSADAGRPSGLAAFTLDLMDEGTTKRDAFKLTADLERLGAQLGSSSDVDTSSLTVSAPKPVLTNALEIFADVVRNPAFNEKDVDRLRRERLAKIAKETADPELLALRLLPPLLFGKGHPYAAPLTGSGSVTSVGAISRIDFLDFQRDWIRPDNATIFVVGDVSMAEILPQLETALGDWRAPSSNVPKKDIAEVALAAKSRIIMIDTPGSPQSVILGAHLLPPTGDSRYIETQLANDIVGGVFTSRVNMNLREEKGWAYGAETEPTEAKGQRMLFYSASVQSDKTAESLVEILKETRNYLTSKPATQEEFEHVMRYRVNALPGRYETSTSVLTALMANDRFGRPQDYVSTLPALYRSMKLADVRAAAKAAFHPDQVTWIIVGDRKKIEAGVRALNVGPIEFWDQNELRNK